MTLKDDFKTKAGVWKWGKRVSKGLMENTREMEGFFASRNKGVKSLEF